MIKTPALGGPETGEIDNARNLFRNGRTDEAQPLFEKILDDRSQGWTEAGLTLAGIHHRAGRSDDAREILQTLVDDAPLDHTRETAQRLLSRIEE